MSTRSDFKMFSEMYDSIYREADLSGEENAQSAIAGGNPTGQFTSGAPGTAPTQPQTSTTGVVGPASTALQNLQSELQKLQITDPTVNQHIQGISTILQNHQPPSPGQGSVA